MKKTTTVAITALLVAQMMIVGCRATSSSSKPTLPAYKPDPLKAPIEVREAKKLPPRTGNQPVQVKKDQPAPFAGILMDGYLAAKYKLIKAERDKLRTIIQIDRTAQGRVHKVMNDAFDEMVRRAKRGWWERNKGTIGFWGGLVIGTFTTVLTVYGVSKASK